MKHFLSWFDTHAFLMTTAPTSTAAALSGEIEDVNSINGGNPSVNIKENYHIDGDGYASKTAISKNIEDIEINFDRAAGSIYTVDGTDAYSRFRSWEENAGSEHKYFVVVTKRDGEGEAAYEGVYYDIINAGMTEGERNPDDIQNITQRLAVSGGRKRCTISKSEDGSFTWKTA